MDRLKLIYTTTHYVDGVGTIHKPTIEDIINIGGEEKYNELIIPFLTTTDVFDIPDNFKNEVRTFDLFFFRKPDNNFLLEYKGKSMIEILIESLIFFFRDEINLVFEPTYNTYGITIGSSNDIEKMGVINRNNFDEVSDLVLEVNNIKRSEVEKDNLPEAENDKQREIRELLKKGRERNKDTNNKIKLDTICNIVQFGGNSFIPYQEVIKMTLPQLYNAYANIMNKEYFNREFDKYLAGVEVKDLDLTHWTEKIRKQD